MRIGALASVLLLLILQTSAAAEIYRCQTSDGRVVLTDKPLNLSDDCEQIKEDTSKGAYSGRPEEKRTRPPGKARTSKQATPDQSEQKSDPAAWESRAYALVASYKDAVKRRFHESNIFDKQQAIRDVEAIKQEKGSFLEELERSSIPQQKRKEVEKILGEIPN
jgi:hypothetical protein